MALVLADRVKETSNTTGTGTFVLAGPSTGFQSFAVIGDSNTTYYTIQNPGTNEWEVGVGTYYSANTSIVRTTVFSSSNANSVVSFSSGVKDVFVTYPSENAVTTLIANTFTNNQVISVNSASTALVVTQAGAGNALSVSGTTVLSGNVTVSGGANITGASTISGNLTTKLLTTTSGPFDSGTGATWTNPRTIASWATIELWGAGGGGGGSASGGAGGGGGGGAYFSVTVPFSYLGATETYTVGGGGANVSTNTNGSAGGNTTFTVSNWPGGSKTFSAYGGGGGGGASSTGGYAGGGGGGVLGVGGSAAAGTIGQGGAPLSAAQVSGNGNEGYGGAAGSGSAGVQGGFAYYGGGGGGAGENGTGTGTTGLGGNSIYGGGGGGGGNDTGTVRCPGGTSIFGGKGGDGGYGNNTTAAQNGTVPGGGGGGSDLGTAGSGNGASGRVLVTIW